MSLSTSDDGTGLEWAGALGARGLFPTTAHLRDRHYLRMLAEIPRFHRQARQLLDRDDSSGPARPHPGRVPRPWPVHAVLPPPLRRAARRGRLVLRPRRRRRLPRRLPVHLPAPPRHARRPRLADVAHGHRRLPVLRRPGRGRDRSRGRQRPHRDGGHRGVGGGCLGDRPHGAPARSTTTPSSSPLIRTRRWPSWPTPRRCSGRSSAPSRTRRTPRCCTPTPGCCRAARNAWASWNFRRPVVDQGSVRVTYDLTRLQRLPTPTHYLVTLGGEHLVDPATVIARRDYAHPLYTPSSVAARDRLDEVDTPRVRFAGAYHGWGFHEDGARSGLEAVEGLGLGWPAVRPTHGDAVLDDHHAHPSDTVPPHLPAPLPPMGGRPRPPPGDRPARVAPRDVRCARPLRRSLQHDPQGP